MNWKKEIKVGDSFYINTKTHYAIVLEMDSNQIIWDWYKKDGRKQDRQCVYLSEFYEMEFIIPMTDLEKALM